MCYVIAYTYDSDVHCINCMVNRFPEFAYFACNRWHLHGYAKDSQGNPAMPVFDTDEHPPEGLYCGDCQAVIKRPLDEKEVDNFVNEGGSAV